MGNAFCSWSYGDSLEHHGIKGQRWGIRNFQNEDGTLTAEGKSRYRVSRTERKERRAEQKAEKKAAKLASIPESKTWKAKEARYLSDAELNRRNNRLQKEEQYKRMTESKGAKYKRGLKKTAKTMFVGTATGLAVQYVRNNYSKLFSAIGKTPVAQAGASFIKNNLGKIKINL